MTVYLSLFVAGLAWGVWVGFGELLLGGTGRARAPGPRVRLISLPGAAILAATIGGTGALLTLEGRLAAGWREVVALGVGTLVALLVVWIAGAYGPEADEAPGRGA